jgi:uridine kinase
VPCGAYLPVETRRDRCEAGDRLDTHDAGPISVAPLSAGRQIDDISTLARSAVFRRLSIEELGVVVDALDLVALPRGAVLIREGDDGEHAYVVLDGAARERRGAIEVRTLGPGDHFGTLALAGVHRRSSSVEALSAVRLARLSSEHLEALGARDPGLALHLSSSIAAALAVDLEAMTDRVSTLLRQRSVPRRAEISVKFDGESRVVPTGTPLGELLPFEIEGARVVGALIDERPVRLDAPLVSDARVAPLTMASWEGRELYRRSLGLLLLEGAHRVAPNARVRLAASLTSGRVVHVEDAGDDLPSLAARIERAMHRIVAEGAEFREELWTVEEARAQFAAQGWEDAVALLGTWRDATVPLASCGELYALAEGPFLTSAGGLTGFRVIVHPEGLLVDFGEQMKRHMVALTLSMEQEHPRFSGEMIEEEKRWLASLGVTSVGSFDEQCVTGGVRELIRVSEGFHEKRIGRIADEIDARRKTLRIIAIAGPSSSGKTTFIKRLTVQLEIVGLRPISLSLDDYYVDREDTVRDADGELDFEAFEATNHTRLRAHVARLLAGERVKTARYDFIAGKGEPEGGAEVRLDAGNVLLVEGIHGLNPALFGSALPREALFRIFVHPATTLPLDRLTDVGASDVRLVRRLVRDRHQRGHKAAATIARWPSVRRGEQRHILPFQHNADAVFDSALVYEMGVLKVFAERYLLEVRQTDPSFPTAYRLRRMLDRFVTIYPDHVPPTSILREFIGGSGFEY